MGERKKKLIIAVNCAVQPDWAPCSKCDCVDGDAGFPKWELPGVFEQTRKCPAREVTGDSRQWISLYSHYKAGFMAVDGGVLCQPNAYLEAMRLIEQWANREHGD